MKDKKTFSVRLESAAEKTVGFFGYLIISAALISVAICLFVYCRSYANVFSYKELVWLLPAALLLLVAALLGKLMQKLREKQFLGIMLCGGLLLSLAIVFSYDTKPCSDYALIYGAAKDMAASKFTYGTEASHYMYYYNWQLGISAFESLFLRIWDDFFVLKLLNILVMGGSMLLEYFMVKRKFGEATARYAYVLAVLYLPWCITVPQFSNQHIVLLILLIVLNLLEKTDVLSWSVSGAALAAMNVIRPMAVLVLLSAGCVTVYELIKNRCLAPVKRIAALLVCYVVVLYAFNGIFIAVGYTDTNISSARVEYFKLQKGLYGYNEIKTDLEKFDYDYDAYNAAMKTELVDEVTSNPLGIVKFVANKMVRYLGLFDYKFEMTYNQDAEFYTQYPVKAVYSTGWFQYLGVLALALIGLRSYRKKHKVDIYQVFFIGNTLVYIFIEAFSSYRYENYAFLIMFAAEGMRLLSQKEVEPYSMRS